MEIIYTTQRQAKDIHIQDWYKIAESLKPTDKGTEGEVRHLGLGDWCEYIYTTNTGWYLRVTLVSDFTEAFKA